MRWFASGVFYVDACACFWDQRDALLGCWAAKMLTNL